MLADQVGILPKTQPQWQVQIKSTNAKGTSVDELVNSAVL